MNNILIDGRLFEWDNAKNKLNKIKHGINFKTAAKVFNTPYVFKGAKLQAEDVKFFAGVF